MCLRRINGSNLADADLTVKTPAAHECLRRVWCVVMGHVAEAQIWIPQAGGQTRHPQRNKASTVAALSSWSQLLHSPETSTEVFVKSCLPKKADCWCWWCQHWGLAYHYFLSFIKGNLGLCTQRITKVSVSKTTVLLYLLLWAQCAPETPEKV